MVVILFWLYVKMVGNALEELENIPCLVAGSTQKCLSIIYDYTENLQKRYKVREYRRGEILKLTSNAFRALNCFSG